MARTAKEGLTQRRNVKAQVRRDMAVGRLTTGKLIQRYLYLLVTYLMYIHVGKGLPTYCVKGQGRNHGRVPPNVGGVFAFGGSHPCIRPTALRTAYQGL